MQHTPEHGLAEVPLPGRRESLALLEQRLPTMAERTRTAMRGIVDTWQPSDFLPDLSRGEVAIEEIRTIQRQARTLSPELLTVLVGDAMTEDGLPLFASRLFSLQGLPTTDSGDAHPRGGLQAWFRAWAAEEHRHGELLNSYMRFTGRVDMKAYERSVQMFNEDGIDLGIDADPYKGFVYTSFQELATQRSHANVARLAKEQGNPLLARICGQIAADEAYHAKAYIAFVRTFFERDPSGMMQALRDMLQRGIVMPAHNMREVDPDGRVLQPGELYAYFSDVAQRLEVYTAKDYAEISGQILTAWKVGVRKENRWEALPFDGLDEAGRDAQHAILRRQSLTEKIAARERTIITPARSVSWLVREQA